MANPQQTDGNTTGDGDLARRWITRINQSEKWQADYITRCQRIVRRYREERNDVQTAAPVDGQFGGRRFAILWSNIETLKPSVYARTPMPVVTRRYKDADPTGRYASEVLERALSYSMDQYEFDDHMKLSRDDFLLLARGQVWARYVPHKAVDEARENEETEDVEDEGPSVTDTAETPETIPYAEALCDHVAYDDWGYEPCRSWDETSFVWRRVYLDKASMVERFGKLGNKVPLDWSPKDDTTNDPSSPAEYQGKRGAVYEIWDKTTRKVYWINKNFPEQCLDVKDDWLGLRGFFPCPRPLMGTLAPDDYIPIPDYVYYQDQAAELDELTERIASLTDSLKLVGVFAGEEGANLQNLFQQPNGTLVPINSMAGWTDRGGFKGLIEWLPLDMVVNTLKSAIETRKQILDDIYQITGMSDILRGASDPDETATAQGIKAQWGSVRVRDKQKEIARFARDILRIKAEIISKQFGIETLKVMTDVKLLTQAEKDFATQAMQAQPPIPMPPELQTRLQEGMNKPTWEEVNALLKDDALRGFRVDVETDSTIEPNETEEKLRRVEFVTAMSQLIGASLPMLQAAPTMAPLIGQTVLFLARGFRVGREMEDVIETAFEEIPKLPPPAPEGATGDPNALPVAQMELQIEQTKQQGEMQRAQMEMQMMQAEMPLRQTEQQIKIAALQRDPEPQVVSN